MKANHLGRIPVQVKGRTIAGFRGDPPPQTQNFRMSRHELAFFAKQKSVLYFLVVFEPDGSNGTVYFCWMRGQNISRILGSMRKNASKASVPFKLMPTDQEQIWALLELACMAAELPVVAAPVELADAVHLTVLNGQGIWDATGLNPLYDDFLLTTVLPGLGLEVALDWDIQLSRSNYRLPFDISSKTMTYPTPLVKSHEPDGTICIQFSPCLEILVDSSTGVRFAFRLTGAWKEVVEAHLFVQDTMSNRLITFGARVVQLRDDWPNLPQEFTIHHEMAERILTLGDYLGLESPSVESFGRDSSERSTLLRLYEYFCGTTPPPAPVNQEGLMRLSVGDSSILALSLLSPGDSFHSFVDPLNPSREKSSRRHLQSATEDQEILQFATFYDGLQSEDLAEVLNLHLNHLVAAYEQTPISDVQERLATETALRILLVCDKATEHRRVALANAAVDLCEFLLRRYPQSTAHRINLWQARSRLQKLPDQTLKDIATFRRSLAGKEDGSVAEFCCWVLLGNATEANALFGELSANDQERLRSYPIWNLYMTLVE